MGALMSVGCGTLRKAAMLAGCLFLALQPCLAQNAAHKPAASTADSTRELLIEKAQALEARGRPDMAIQLWQQILLSDPNNVESLAGLARDLKLTGSDKAIDALDRLRKVSPNSPDIAKIQGLAGTGANPAPAAELRDPIKQHPQDMELAGHAKEDEGKPAQTNTGIARTPAERAAFADLNAHHLDEAEKRLMVILNQEPNNGRVAAGMGFLRMQQNNFPDAINYLDRAEANGFKDHAVEDALATSHFWIVMDKASQAFNANQLDVADAKYREALNMRPRAPDALNGLAGLLIKQQQFTGAALLYDQLVKVQPNSTDGWRSLFMAYARDNQNAKALAVEARIPPPVKTVLTRDAEYLRTLAFVYQAENRPADAEKALTQELALPFPDSGVTLKADIKLKYAGILMQARRYDLAVPLYAQLLTGDPGNLAALEGMLTAQHAIGQDTAAIAQVHKMPPAVYEAALGDSAFLTLLAAIYQQAGQYEVAQNLLDRAANQQIASGGQVSISLDLQLAGLYLLRNETARAYNLYNQVLIADPDSVGAWKGMIAALTVTDRATEALRQLAFIPMPVRKQLDADVEFLQSEASLYAAHYAKLHADPPAAVEIQNAWLLFNTQNDRQLYPTLMHLDSHAGMSVAQRETIQDIWANWAVRRAAAAMDNGNVQRAVDILDAASQAFPGNLTVRKAIAGGYAQVGRARESLALFKTVPMQDATAGDYQGAIGAALAANDKAQAELWLRPALDRYPQDPAILSLAARFEQARGDNDRAAEYFRASLAATHAVSQPEKRAHVLVYPDQDALAHRALTGADLQRLLDPGNEPLARTTRLSSLPAYGQDPYNDAAPVVAAPAPSSGRQLLPDSLPTPKQLDAPKVFPPSAIQGQTSPAPVYVPQP
jgi:tetratricopeptide (TPR) repeat protein